MTPTVTQLEKETSGWSYSARELETVCSSYMRDGYSKQEAKKMTRRWVRRMRQRFDEIQRQKEST